MGIAGWLEDCVWVLAAFFYRGALITIFYDDSFALSECTAQAASSIRLIKFAVAFCSTLVISSMDLE